MEIIELFIKLIIFAEACRSWEYCQSDIQKKLCGTATHFVCDSENLISKSTCKSTNFLAHVPLTRKVKTSFLNWHNYYRNRTAGGWVKNKEKIFFPKAVRMRELLWDSELSYLSHVRTKYVSEGEVTCGNTQRFQFVRHNLIVKAVNDSQPVLEVIASALKQMFDRKNLIDYPEDMPKHYLMDHTEANQFIIMINDRVSRVGCAVALGQGCKKYCYYTACAYDDDNEGVIYKIGKPASRCSRWEVGRSKTYLSLCANSGKIFKRDQ